MKACPYRSDFFAKLAEDPSGQPASQDRVNEGLNTWLTALDAIVARLQKFYADGGHDKGF